MAEALQEAADIVSSTLELDQVLDRILEQVEQVVAEEADDLSSDRAEQAADEPTAADDLQDQEPAQEPDTAEVAEDEPSPDVVLAEGEDAEASVEGDDGEEDEEGEAEPEGPAPEWYVVHGYSGYENRVKKNLEQRIESMDMQDRIFQVVVPTEEEIEIRGGERKIVERRVFPGYILVEMVLDEESWYVVRNTPGVTGFVGTGTRPTPLSEEEVGKIMKRIESAEPKIKVSFTVGQQVRLTGGAFADFVGRVDELYPEKGRAKVLVSMFGRETPLEVELLHLERV